MKQITLLVATLILYGISSTLAANYAVLVAGSNGYYNYRHQADICHAYQILHKHDIPDTNIVVMMYDDIAQNTQNPTKGIIVNHPNGNDVYHGVPHDYTGTDVTPKNFINVLLGNKEAMKGIGSGKVLESGPNDNVFIFYSDHGAVGLVAFPSGGYLYAKDLNQTIATMHAQNKYKQMVLYIEACESGSMVEGLLPPNINVYSTTASNAAESSYACYFDQTRGTYVGDLYSVNWMEDSDAEQIDQETLFQQFTIVKQRTNLSHVMEYGDLTLGQTHKVSEFQAENAELRHYLGKYYKEVQFDAVRTVDVRISIVSQRLAAAKENSAEKAALRSELLQLLRDRVTIATKIEEVASRVLGTNDGVYYQQIITQHMGLTKHDCYKTVTLHMDEKCFDLANEFVLNKLYIMANLCEIGLPEFKINKAIDDACPQRLAFTY